MKLKATFIGAFLAVAAVPAVTFAQDINYRLINSTSMIIAEFYTSPVDVDSWEDDLLGDYVLEPGEEGVVVIADGRKQCEYDLLLVMEDGTELTDTVDICELESYELVE